MTRKNLSTQFGKSFQKDIKRQAAERRVQWAEKSQPLEGGGESRSVLEQSNIDDLIAMVDVNKAEWDDIHGDAEVVEEGPVLLDLDGPLAEAENAAAHSRELVSIPRRPKWHDSMSIEELATLETEAFMEWRRGLRQLADDGGFVMTPYERNLDFWRQLWRCMERSDLLVQVLDARDPDFYFCQDLYKYVSELGGSKTFVLLVNKADFLSREQRQQWADHFESKGVDALFFSALNELEKQEKSRRLESSSDAVDAQELPSQEEAETAVSLASKEPEDSSSPVNIPVPDSDDELDQGDPQAPREESEESEAEEASEDKHEEASGLLLDDTTDDGISDVAKLLDELRARLLKCKADGHEGQRQGVVGFVGYPNVGKSTVINALCGAKKVGTSRTPGKTKHIQTLQLPEWGFTVCDAPGLVFPSVVATRAHLVINNTIPLDDLRECFSPIRLIVEKIGFKEVLRRYKCTAFVKDATKRSGDHVLDEAHSFLAAFAVSRNHLLWVGVPDEQWAARKVLRDYVTGKLLHCELPPGAPEEAKEEEEVLEEEDEFEDLSELMADAASTAVMSKMTKKKERHLQKQFAKGVAPPTDALRRGKNARASGLG